MNIKIRHLFSRNIGYKIFSVVCAVIVWFVVTGQAETFSFLGTKTVPVQVELRNTPANLIVLNELPTIHVDVSAQNSDKEIHAYIDLENAAINTDTGPTSYTIKVDPGEGGTVKKVSPSTLPLDIDKLSDKSMHVETQIIGKPAKGYVAGDPILTPSEVVVRGPQSIIDKMEKVGVEVNIDGADSTLRTSRPIVYKDFGVFNIFSPDPEYKRLTALTGAVDVIVPIYEAGSISKIVPLSVTIDGTVANGYEVLSAEPLPAVITLIGPEQTLAEISEVHLGALSVDDLNSSKVFDIDSAALSLPEKVIMVLDTKIKVLISLHDKIVNI
ncbi:MAG: CdaR family protein [Peptococcaceae bacterium]|nr:CdaR family protein [Peptococcaceae bacterium]